MLRRCLSAQERFCSSLAELSWSMTYKMCTVGLEFEQFVKRVLCFPGHYRVMLMCEDLLPIVLFSSTRKKGSMPGKGRRSKS